jgi:hypothetical protein
MDVDMGRFMEVVVRALPLSVFTYFQSWNGDGSASLDLADQASGGWMASNTQGSQDGSVSGYGRYYVDGVVGVNGSALPASSAPFSFAFPFVATAGPGASVNNANAVFSYTNAGLSGGTFSFSLPFTNVSGGLRDTLLTRPLAVAQKGFGTSFYGKPSGLLRPGGYPDLMRATSGSDWWDREVTAGGTSVAAPSTLMGKLFWSTDVYIHRYSPKEVRIARRGSGTGDIDIPDRFTQAFVVDDSKCEIVVDGATLRNFPVRAGQGASPITFFIDAGQPVVGGEFYPSYQTLTTSEDPVTGLVTVTRSGSIPVEVLRRYRIRLKNIGTSYGSSRIAIVSSNPVIVEGSFFPGGASGCMLVAPSVAFAIPDGQLVPSEVDLGGMLVVSGRAGVTGPTSNLYLLPNAQGVLPSRVVVQGGLCFWDANVGNAVVPPAAASLWTKPTLDLATLPVAGNYGTGMVNGVVFGAVPFRLEPVRGYETGSVIPPLCPALTDVRTMDEDFLSYKMIGVTQ